MLIRATFVFSVFASLFSPTLSFATPPAMPPCVEVTNPELYRTLVRRSDIFELFSGWHLDAIEVPCHPERSPVSVVVQAIVAPPYSPHNLTYYVSAYFLYEGSVLINASGLREMFGNFRSRIMDFENDARIAFYLLATENKRVKLVNRNFYRATEGPVFEFDSLSGHFDEGIPVTSDTQNRLIFSGAKNEVLAFSFSNARVVRGIDVFLPMLATVPAFREFREKIFGLGYAEAREGTYGIESVLVAAQARCPVCGNYLSYSFATQRVTGYRVPSSFEWESLPDVKRVRAYIRGNLLVGDLARCVLDTSERGYTTAEIGYHPLDPFHMHIALECPEGGKSIDLIAYSDGTFRWPNVNPIVSSDAYQIQPRITTVPQLRTPLPPEPLPFPTPGKSSGSVPVVSPLGLKILVLLLFVVGGVGLLIKTRLP